MIATNLSNRYCIFKPFYPYRIKKKDKQEIQGIKRRSHASCIPQYDF
jgi:hypothetical protein